MTASELIEELQKQSPDAIICVYDNSNYVTYRASYITTDDTVDHMTGEKQELVVICP